MDDLSHWDFAADFAAGEVVALAVGLDMNRLLTAPNQDELASIYTRCDAWLFGSRIDSFGLPILEAMACRTPVIAVPIGAAPDLLADGIGVLVAKESPEEMAAAIVAMCRQSTSDWRQHSDRAYLKAHAYSWNDAASCLLDILTQQLIQPAPVR